MKKLCILLIRFYQRFLSPLKRSPCCRFTPTCSAYAIEAFEKRGFFAGMILTAYRLLRCNPFCAPGYDPVPERGFATMSKGIPASNASSDAIDTFDDIPDALSVDTPKPICEDYLYRRPTHISCESDREGKSQGE